MSPITSFNKNSTWLTATRFLMTPGSALIRFNSVLLKKRYYFISSSFASLSISWHFLILSATQRNFEFEVTDSPPRLILSWILPFFCAAVHAIIFFRPHSRSSAFSFFLCAGRMPRSKQSKEKMRQQKKLVNWNCHANYWWIQKSWTCLWSAN